MTGTGEGLRIAVTGSTGFVGSALGREIQGAGWEVVPVVRRSPRAGEVGWDPEVGRIDRNALEGVDAVVHLAGESIAGVWTPARKRRIFDSRARGTQLIASTIATLDRPPRVLVSASGVGYYGNAGDEVLTESSPPGDDFLARVCVAWESATRPAEDAGVRVVRMRSGLVLDARGGALSLMLPAFRFGLGAQLGDGRQWLSWISLPDIVRVIREAIVADDLRGPINAVSPNPVRNEEFTHRLGAALRRPTLLRVPKFALRTFTGGMADALLLTSQRAVPAVLSARNFRFVRPEMEDVLTDPRGT